MLPDISVLIHSTTPEKITSHPVRVSILRNAHEKFPQKVLDFL